MVIDCGFAELPPHVVCELTPLMGVVLTPVIIGPVEHSWWGEVHPVLPIMWNKPLVGGCHSFLQLKTVACVVKLPGHRLRGNDISISRPLFWKRSGHETSPLAYIVCYKTCTSLVPRPLLKGASGDETRHNMNGKLQGAVTYKHLWLGSTHWNQAISILYKLIRRSSPRDKDQWINKVLKS